jgi:hypothetical protein
MRKGCVAARSRRARDAVLRLSLGCILHACQHGLCCGRAETLDGKAFKDYVGEYESRPGDDVEVVSVKDGKLRSRIQRDV